MLGRPTQSHDEQLLIEPVIGWRAWHVGQSYGRSVLISPSQKTVWPHQPGQYLHAVCGHGKADRQHCNCGVNAFATEQLLAQSRYAGAPVWGEVQLWGEVTEYKLGARGELARPGRLWVDSRLDDAEQVAASLAQTYGCPVEVASCPLNAGSKGSAVASVTGEHLSWCAWLAPVALGAIGVAGYLGLTAPARLQQEALAGRLGLDTITAFTIPGSMLLTLVIGVVSAALPLTKKDERLWVAVASLAAVMMVAVGAGLSLYTNFAGHMPESRDEIVRSVAETGEPRTLRVTQLNAVAWGDKYSTLNDSDDGCDVDGPINGKLVQVCHRGKSITFNPLKST